MAKSTFCTECGTRIVKNWKFCKGCGLELAIESLNDEEHLAPVENVKDLYDENQTPTESATKDSSGKNVAIAILVIAIVSFLAIILANNVDPQDFVTRLNKVSEYSWEEDPTASLATSDRYRALRGFYADMCNVYIYDTEAKALDTAKNYLHSELYWWGTDEKTGYGVVIADRGDNSSCSDDAADAFGWTLEH